MKAKTLAAAAACLFTLALPATAAVDADGAAKMTKDNGCTKCHAVEKVAARFKGKADGEAQLTGFLTKSPKVKMDDGSEEEHKAVATKDAAQLKNLVQWILAQ